MGKKVRRLWAVPCWSKLPEMARFFVERSDAFEECKDCEDGGFCKDLGKGKKCEPVKVRIKRL